MHYIKNRALVLSLSTLCACHSACSQPKAPEADEVYTAIERSADWQLTNPSGTELTDWVIAPLYDGLISTAFATGKPEYLEAVMRFGKQVAWSPRWMPYNADDHAVGNAWLAVYLLDQTRTERLEPIKKTFDFIIENPRTEELDFRELRKTLSYWDLINRWTWSDSLYMAPPPLAKLYAATGDDKYLDFLDSEYQFCYKQLYDSEARLFYRDTRYIDQRSPNGNKVFWSRGNGWVYAGLALLLEHYPKERSERVFYEDLFKEMTTAFLTAQQADGLWRTNLHDPEQIPLKELSGSAFIAYGLAWGINNGLLERDTHLQTLYRAWDGLMTCVRSDGYVGYVQQIGSSPDQFSAESTQLYGTGAFLLAGSELLRTLGGASTTSPKQLQEIAQTRITNDVSPRAYARFVPEREDDLAWENDKVAFRIYGPALADSVENSGVDIWCKKVTYPILDKWYRLSLSKEKSYHVDHGEGIDGYKVGDSMGCGGTALLIDGELVMSNVYKAADIHWTSPDALEFKAIYEYPVTSHGKPVYEHRTVRLELGDQLCEVTSQFMHHPRANNGIKDFEHTVAIGLAGHSIDSTFEIIEETGLMAMMDEFGDGKLFAGISIDPERVIEMQIRPNKGAPANISQGLAIVNADSSGSLTYKTGFAWTEAGHITSKQAWIDYLKENN